MADSIGKQLYALNKAMKAEMEAAVTECGEVLQEEAQRLAPYKTGDLHDNIILKETKSYKGLISATVQVGDRKYGKGIAIEYGSVHGAAQPYIRPAVANTEKKREAILWHGFRKVVE
jgi:phage protein, HK97 gp10 family